MLLHRRPHPSLITAAIFGALLSCESATKKSPSDGKPHRNFTVELRENEVNLFDTGLYIGIAGTALMLAILILIPSAGISVSAAYASNIFGILCVAVVKIFHVRQTREALIIEAETAGGGTDLDRTF